MQQQTSPYKEGQTWMFFLATRYIIGRVVSVSNLEIVLDQASWIPDTGRMYDALSKGDFTEVEPFPSGICVVGRLAINDATPCNYSPPKKQK